MQRRPDSQRVVITGLGAFSPLGHSVDELWSGLVAGRSGVGPITQFDTGELPCKIAGEVKNFKPTDYINIKEARRMGRSSQLAIATAHQALADAGLPIPLDVRRIDLALTRGVPGFIDTLRTVLAEMQVQSVIVAEETGQKSPHILAAIKQLLPTTPIELVSHELLKADTEGAVAVVRTGEFTPYANIILVSGVVF